MPSVCRGSSARSGGVASLRRSGRSSQRPSLRPAWRCTRSVALQALGSQWPSPSDAARGRVIAARSTCSLGCDVVGAARRRRSSERGSLTPKHRCLPVPGFVVGSARRGATALLRWRSGRRATAGWVGSSARPARGPSLGLRVRRAPGCASTGSRSRRLGNPGMTAEESSESRAQREIPPRGVCPREGGVDARDRSAG